MKTTKTPRKAQTKQVPDIDRLMKYIPQEDERKHFQSCHVAAFEYNEGPFCIDRLKPGTELKMVRELSNRYDANAVALYFGKHKVGYIPRNENTRLAMFLEMGWGDMFQAVVNRVTPEVHPEGQLGIVIYLLRRDIAEE